MKIFILFFIVGILNLLIGCSLDTSVEPKTQKDYATQAEDQSRNLLEGYLPPSSQYDKLMLPETNEPFSFSKLDFVTYDVYSGDVNLHSLLTENTKNLRIVQINTANHLYNNL